MAKGETHKHKYERLVLIPVIQDGPEVRTKGQQFVGYGFDLPHFGTVKPTAFLARKCACGAREAIEYGERHLMKELGTKYAQLQKARLISSQQAGLAPEGPDDSQGTAPAP